ncbi:MAG: glycosyltransferase [Prevotella sp.]|nr:glycosyltransferase [Prevotella sp.]
MTIGIPVYQAEKYLSRALESSLVQSYPSIEFLIVDDGSTDGSLSIAQDFQRHHPRGADIRIISHDHNLGVSVARNRIIDEASGTYLYFMDADDTMAGHTIALLMDNIRHYEAEMAFGSYEKIGTDGEREIYQYPELQLLGEDQLASFAYRKYAGIQASACNYLVKTSLLREHHHRFMKTDYWEDLVFTFDLVTLVSRAVLLPDITYYYWCHENSLSRYQHRHQIPKEEILRNARTVDHLRETSALLYNKVYYPNRCYIIVMTGFYMACNVLKRRRDIAPSMSDGEIRALLTHPASFRQICHFHQSRFMNLVLYLLGRLPARLCVRLVYVLGKLKKLV